MNRPGKPKGLYYLSHQAVDCEHGIIVGVTATSGDVNDSAPFLNLVEHVQKTVNIQGVTADAAYDFPLAHRVLHDQNISFLYAHRRNLIALRQNSPVKGSRLTRRKTRMSARKTSP